MLRLLVDHIYGEATRALPRRVPLLIVASFGSLLIASVAALGVALRADNAAIWVAHTITVQTVARDALSAVQDAETGQRGYLLTGQRDFLQPFAAAEQKLPGAIERLRTLVADNPEQTRNIEQLVLVLAERLDLLRLAIELQEQGRRSEAIDESRLLRGKAVMDAVRAVFGRINDIQVRLLEERTLASQKLNRWLLVLLALAACSALCSIWFAAREIRHFVTRLSASNAALDEAARLRLETEATLRQAQKMDAVGQLTGGIAHDFNNLLTIVMGNLDTIKRRVAGATDQGAQSLGQSLGRPIDMALHGCRSAAQLTHRLLAFSRQQPLEPVTLDLNGLVSGLSDLLRRSVGEAVEVETVLAGGLWQTFADPGQVENTLINLAINARDAMPDGGRLTIETANSYLDDAYVRRFSDVAAGQYVMLSVSDSGTGIAPELIDRVFDPFFTTKEVGKGTGLGLAMVHGFVKQSKGHVRIYSELGQGTTVKIYLPRQLETSAVRAAPASSSDVSAAPLRARPGERILLVEDNAGVREYAQSVLTGLGYELVLAANAAEALDAIRTQPAFDLLFSYVVLSGGMNGRELANQVAALCPALPVLFTTGYTRNAIVHNGMLDAGVHLLVKPYTEQDLAQKVRRLIG